ncbi:MAG: alkaline phosphatase family protein, partial [Deltaproteobacteria bacterium]|nr:alkaline phosphatase family protein [Deltaproteobacteria bacterium]
MRRWVPTTTLLVLAVLWPGEASAYIGPGAGFAFAGSLLVLLATFALALVTVLTWPINFVWRLIRVGNPFKHAQAKRIVVLGLDGMDPGIATRLMREGRLPNFQKLADKGVFRPLATSTPSMSPVAWSTYTTGVDASHHRIYDFLTRDPCSYQPMLSSTDIIQAKKVLNIGPYVIPLERPRIKLLQRSQAFWKLLGQKHIFSIIQRVPITFPPVPFNGLLLSAMCTPDLRGSQGTFSFFSTESEEGKAKFTGGEQTVLRRNPKKPGVVRSRIVGPDNGMLKSGGRMTRLLGVDHPVVPGHARGEGLRDRAVLPELGGARRQPLHDPDPHRPEQPGDADQPPLGLRDLPGQAAGSLRHPGAGRGHLGAQRAGHRRKSLLRPGDALLQGARGDVPRCLASHPAGLRDHGLRHHRPRPAHVLPLPRPHPPRERGQGHRGACRRDRKGVRGGRRPARTRLARDRAARHG